MLQQSGSEQTLHLYGEGGEWLCAYNANGAPAQQVVWLGSRPIGLIQAGKLLYVESDHLGSPRAVIDPQRDVAVWVWSLLGESFADGIPIEDPDEDGVAQELGLRFPGQRWDEEGGLSYNYFRDYESAAGRYLQSDPIGLDGGMSSYSYVEGSPLQYKDPTGLVKHHTGKEIDCGKGCWIRIDSVFNEKTGEMTRHLHWGCKGREAECGENGLPSHGGTWDQVPSFVKECALKNGFLGKSVPIPKSENGQDYEMAPGAKAAMYSAAALWMLGTLIWGW